MQEISREDAKKVLIQATGALPLTRDQHQHVLKCVEVLYQLSKCDNKDCPQSEEKESK